MAPICWGRETISIDIGVAHFMAGLNGTLPVADYLFVVLGPLNSFKLLPLVAGLFWLWASDRGDGRRRRHVFDAVMGALLAIVIARLVQNLGPHRLRPLSSPLFDFGNGASGIADWSSFPSDTTALVAALSLGIWMASRPAGWLAILWALFTILSKLYAGYHYPTDILAGAAIGLAATFIVSRLGGGLFARADKAARAYPALFAFLAFIAAFQLTTLFDDLRHAAREARGALKGMERSEPSPADGLVANAPPAAGGDVAPLR